MQTKKDEAEKVQEMYQNGFTKFFNEFGDFDCHVEDFKRKNERIHYLQDELIKRDDELNCHKQNLVELFDVNRLNRDEIQVKQSEI